MRDEEKAHYLFLSNTVAAIAVFCATVWASMLAAIFISDEHHAMIVGSVCGLIISLCVKVMNFSGAMVGMILALIAAFAFINPCESAPGIVFLMSVTFGLGAGLGLKLSVRAVKNLYRAAVRPPKKNPR